MRATVSQPVPMVVTGGPAGGVVAPAGAGVAPSGAGVAPSGARVAPSGAGVAPSGAGVAAGPGPCFRPNRRWNRPERPGLSRADGSAACTTVAPGGGVKLKFEAAGAARARWVKPNSKAGVAELRGVTRTSRGRPVAASIERLAVPIVDVELRGEMTSS